MCHFLAICPVIDYNWPTQPNFFVNHNKSTNPQNITEKSLKTITQPAPTLFLADALNLLSH